MIPTSTTESLLGRPKTALKMRVCSATHRDQVIQLESAKITIGSSRRCTLRLKSPQVAPVQCLILRGENEMVVRSCSANTRLNNSVFDETTLRCGDRLSIGPIELVVLDDHAAVATAGGQAVVENTGAERGGQTDLETRLRSLEQQKQDWLAAKAQEGQLLLRQREELTNEQRQFEQQQADLNSRQQQFDEKSGNWTRTAAR
jgi:pSer/pThr/pTyr-binding forkhead associated (FHA) protein